jgi:hypothetical protein
MSHNPLGLHGLLRDSFTLCDINNVLTILKGSDDGE